MSESEAAGQQNFDEEEVLRILDGIFTQARETDEFEYACTLLRVRGMESDGWDPLTETGQLFDEIGSLLQAPLKDHARIRLGLLLYSHLTEVDAIYEILVNLVRVTKGERYSMSPFMNLYKPADRPRHEQIPPSAKRVVEQLAKESRKAGFADLDELLRWFFANAVRNAFFHSDYVLYQDELRSREASFAGSGGVRRSSMKLNDVTDLINRGILFYQVFMATYWQHRMSYRAEKQIEGRFGAGGTVIPVTLLADGERGLYGIRSS